MGQFGVRDEFPYPPYQRPEEGQTLDFLRNQYNTYPSASTYESTQSAPYMTASSPNPAATAQSSIGERQKFLKDMQKFRSTLAQGSSSVASH